MLESKHCLILFTHFSADWNENCNGDEGISWSLYQLHFDNFEFKEKSWCSYDSVEKI